MERDKLPANIDAELAEWMGKSYAPPSHFWEQDGTYFIIVRTNMQIRCIRIFPIDNELALSQDNIIYC